MRRLLLALVLLLLPLAQAQEGGTGITISADETPTIPFDSAGDFNYTVEIGCLELALSGGDPTVTVTGDGPNWATFQTSSVALNPATCLTEGAVSQSISGSLAILADASAPGKVLSPVNLTATLAQAGADPVTDTVGGGFFVDYRPGHTFRPSVAFPVGVPGDSLSFNVTINITANARTMFMYGNVTEGLGSLSGLAFKTVEEATEFVLPFTFTAPSGDWNETTFQFDIWSHYLSPTESGSEQMRTTQSWTFINLNEGGSGGTDAGKDSPGFGVFALVGALVALAALRRR